jgi:hypothetical protein
MALELEVLVEIWILVPQFSLTMHTLPYDFSSLTAGLSGVNSAKVDSISFTCFDFFFITLEARPFDDRTVVLANIRAVSSSSLSYQKKPFTTRN